MQDYAQDLASQEYQNAYGRFADQRNFGYGAFMDDYNRERTNKMDQYNRLRDLTGIGQNTAANLGAQQMAQGGNLANLDLLRGNVGATRSMAGYQGGMNLLNTGLEAAGTVKGMGG